MPPVKGQKARVDEFKKRLETATKAQKKHRDSWADWTAVYRGKADLPDTSRDLLRNQVRTPYAYQQIESIIPRIVDPEPVFDFLPVEPGDKKLSDILNVLVRWQLNSDRFVKRQRAWIEDAMVKGLAVAKIVWKREERELRVRQRGVLDPFRGWVLPEAKPERHVVVNRPTILRVPPEDFFWDPNATSDDDWTYVFHRVWLTMDELEARQKAGVYKNVGEIRARAEQESSPRGRETTEEAWERRGNTFAVYECHTADRIIVMCGDTLLRDDEREEYHGEIPFAAFSTQPTGESLVGTSEVEMIAPLQIAMWITDNQRFDAVAMSTNIITVLDPTIEGVRNLSVGPGSKILAGHHQRVDQFRLDPNTAPSMQQTDALAGWMQQVTGASPFLAGPEEGSPADTATGSSILMEETNRRMVMKKMEFRLFEAKIAKLMVQLDHQYLSPAEIERIVGEAGADYEPPHPSEIPMFLDVIPRGMAESMSKQVERNSKAEALAQFSGLHGAPMGQGRVFTVEPIANALAETYDLQPDLLYMDEQEFLPQVEQQAVAEAGGIPPGGEPTMEDETMSVTEDSMA